MSFREALAVAGVAPEQHNRLSLLDPGAWPFLLLAIAMFAAGVVALVVIERRSAP